MVGGVRAGLPLESLSGIFLTHLHSDHVVDYYAYPLLASLKPAKFQQVPVCGPGPAGEDSLAPSVQGPVPGTLAMTQLAGETFAASTTFFMAEHIGIDPASLVNVHEVMPPGSSGDFTADREGEACIPVAGSGGRAGSPDLTRDLT